MLAQARRQVRATFRLALAAAAIAPLNYLRLIMMTVIGWLLYAETLTLMTIVGAFLILSSAFFTIRNNARSVKEVNTGVEAPPI